MNRLAITVIGIVIVFSGGASVKAQSGALYCRICRQFFPDEASYLSHMRSHGGGSSSNPQSSGPSASQIAAQQAAAAQQQAAAEQRAQEEQAERDADAEATAKKAAHDAEVARQIREGREVLSQLRGLSQDSGSVDSGYKGLNDTDRGSAGFRTLPDVNTDPNLVDARNVATGLPKSVADEIPNTAAGNRVRKGFGAIMDHDWKVAHAWFQDALNHDPGNAGLRRLVDLAQYTLQRQGRETSARPGREDAGEINRALNDYTQALVSKYPELEKNMTSDSDEEFLKREDPAWHEFFRYITSKLPRPSLKGPVPLMSGRRG